MIAMVKSLNGVSLNCLKNTKVNIKLTWATKSIRLTFNGIGGKCVRIACETLSNSAADAIDLLRNKGVAGFEGSEPTTKFMRHVNNSFDVLNSKVDDAIGFKRTISRDTKEEYFRYFDEAISYFQNIKLTPRGKSILRTRSRTPFFGFILDLNNFRSFFNQYVESNILSSVATFRFSQDHLELLFGCIRSMFGCNDNPSARHLESAWRKLLCLHQIQASDSANCANNDVGMLNVLNVSSRKISSTDNRPIDVYSLVALEHIPEQQIFSNEFEEEEKEDEFSSLCFMIDENHTPNAIEQHVVSYTGAVIEKFILAGRWFKRITCKECLCAFQEDSSIDDAFVNTKLKTKNMRPPAYSTVKICMATETALRKFNFEAGCANDVLHLYFLLLIILFVYK